MVRIGIYPATAAIALMIGTTSLFSQAPAATEQPSLQPGSDAVSLDLAVRDRHKKPVLDLKPEQVTVADNGKPARLTELHLVNGDRQNEPLITLLFDRPGMADSERVSEDSLFAASASTARAFPPAT